MSMPLNDMPIDELIRTARNYANCLQPITTYTEIMHELLNRLDAMRVHAKVLANEAAAIKCMNDCLAEELQVHQPQGAAMHNVWWKCETPLTNGAIATLRNEAIASALDSCSEYCDGDCLMENNGFSYEEAQLRAQGAAVLHNALLRTAARQLLESKGEVCNG